MNIPKGTVVGRLVSNRGHETKEIRFGEILVLDPLHGTTVLQNGEGLQLLVLLPIHASETVVISSGKKQGGAFLLQSGREFCLSQQGLKTSFYFEALPSIEVRTGEEEMCNFCRSSLTDKRGIYCLSPILDEMETGILLCFACAAAWGSAANQATEGMRK